MDESKILKLLGRVGYAPSNIPELLQTLHMQPNQQQELQQALRGLEARGDILRTKGGRYILAREADLVPGLISINRQGKGFVQPDEPGQTEITIPESATGTALNGDRVLVRREVKALGLRPAKPQETTGTVVRILERKRMRFAGTLQCSKQLLFVIPDDPRIPHNIFVPPPKDVGREARAGDKVVVEIISWENRQSPPEGEVVEVLGAPGEEGVDMLSVLRNYDLPLHFPRDVLAEAQTITSSRSLTDASPADLKGRTDCRGDLVITIDPDDAKDFDDAICVSRLSADRVRLWVHIADVSHYVKPGGPLDAEARKRGNSTYLVDRVIPMLPEALSNELCSLKPGVDRLTKCVEFLLDGAGKVLEAKFYPSVIRSQRRFSYQEALSVIQQPVSKDNPIEQMVHEAHALAQTIRKARFKAGSLDMDFPENKIRLDAQGKVSHIERMENDVSHQLIEEFMLLANEAVAGRLMQLNRPAVYRVHEAPKPQRLLQYREEVLSHHVPCGNLTVRHEVQKLLQRFATLDIGGALKIGFLKSLMRARYAVEPLGHYGLAKTKYTHFTSPIRRYADLVVHRALFGVKESNTAALKDMASHLSVTERNSADAERDSRDVKLYAWLKGQLESGNLQTYPGLVIDVRNFGFFVDVPTLGMSGLVHLSSFQNEFFAFDPSQARFVGRSSRRVIKLGDHVDVRVWRVDSFKKQIDFQLVTPDSRPAPAKSRPSAKVAEKAPAGRQSRKQPSPPRSAGKVSRRRRS